MSIIDFAKRYEMDPKEMGLCGGAPINDLANDLKADKRMPREDIKTGQDLICYLDARCACDGALRAARDLSGRYNRHLKMKGRKAP